MLFNEKLKRIRKENNLTQEELSEKLNVSRQAITKWESGEGIPDIENLKQISNMFNISIDELVKEEKDINIDAKKQYMSVNELEIDHNKHFDINISKIFELNIKPIIEEKVKVEISSNDEENIEELLKVKFDNLYNRLDIDIKNKSKANDITINLYIPEKYINDIELKSKLKYLNIYDIYINELEFDGVLKYFNVYNSKGKMILNATKCDIEAKYDNFDGILEINTINSIARVSIPKETKYKTILKGIKNEFINSINSEESENIIELNGINSKIIINEMKNQ